MACAGGLVHRRYEPGARGQGLGRGDPGHISAGLGEEHRRHDLPDTGMVRSSSRLVGPRGHRRLQRDEQFAPVRRLGFVLGRSPRYQLSELGQVL